MRGSDPMVLARELEPTIGVQRPPADSTRPPADSTRPPADSPRPRGAVRRWGFPRCVARFAQTSSVSGYASP
ncbi:hypothetical protein EYF80_068098 [Liparis tanakae]|uniref:Uncharacterized protein n=1 Tax=Liparis tanakae TaxID=230148 RepID=A0A4Z2DZ16_9TELE|nr:hypothetical protein EYF80_068098 [Liparis tanakae]